MLLAKKSRNVIDVFRSVLLLVKLSVVKSFSRRKFCLIPSISRLYGAGNCRLRFSGVCSKVVNQLSQVSR